MVPIRWAVLQIDADDLLAWSSMVCGSSTVPRTAFYGWDHRALCALTCAYSLSDRDLSEITCRAEPLDRPICDLEICAALHARIEMRSR